MQRPVHHGWRTGSVMTAAIVTLSGCGVFSGASSGPAPSPVATALPVIQQVALDRDAVRPGDMDRLVVTLHSPSSGPARAVAVVSYPDGSQITVQGQAGGRPLDLSWTVPVDMGSGTARYDVVVSQVCGCGTATSATWDDAKGTFLITR